MRVPFAVFIAAIATSTCFGSAPSCAVPKDEMQVITSYIKWSTDGKQTTVLVSSTEASDIDIDYVSLRLGMAGHGIPPEARNDLKHKNASACSLGTISGIPTLRTISQSDHDRIFRGREGWSRLHARFGKNARLVNVSRVGFNSDHTIALFYSTEGIARMAGSCCLYVFRLRNGKWVKDGEAPVWNT